MQAKQSLTFAVLFFLPLQLSKTDIAIIGDVVTRDTIELLVGPNHEDVSSLDE